MQRHSNTVIEEPSGLLSDAESAMNLVRTDSVFAVHNEPHRHQPFVQTDGRVLHDRAGFRGELTCIMLCAALPTVVLLSEDRLVATATWADDTFRPAAANQVLTAVCRFGEVDNRFLKSAWFRCHELRIAIQE